MVLTITLNPLLEKRFLVNNLEVGKSNKSTSEYYYAGGKGINVSRQLNNLGIENQALFFAGGGSGKILRKILGEESVSFSIVNTKADTRTASLIIDNDARNITTVFGMNSIIDKREADELLSRAVRMIPNASTIVLSGSSPGKSTDHIFPSLIEEAHKHDKTIILDTYGPHLWNCYEKAPTVIHNNFHEIISSTKVNIKERSTLLEFIKTLYDKGIKLGFITDSKNKAAAFKFDFNYEIIPPRIDTFDSTGSGDAFVAGIVYGLEKSMVFENFVSVASAMGAVNAARSSVCDVELYEIDPLKDQVKIVPIGKKMKLIDDSPTTD
ncbi:MAG: 1-phosphofructokinase [Melioribacteraceae bacterium]|nr:1-phosphofructokinase [Melioribacteraceae bacterium]